MKQAIVNMAKVFGQLIAIYYDDKFDHATNALIVALIDWVEANDK